jgi:hypothetical protein
MGRQDHRAGVVGYELIDINTDPSFVHPIQMPRRRRMDTGFLYRIPRGERTSAKGDVDVDVDFTTSADVMNAQGAKADLIFIRLA